MSPFHSIFRSHLALLMLISGSIVLLIFTLKNKRVTWFLSPLVCILSWVRIISGIKISSFILQRTSNPTSIWRQHWRTHKRIDFIFVSRYTFFFIKTYNITSIYDCTTYNNRKFFINFDQGSLLNNEIKTQLQYLIYRYNQ